MDSRDQMERDLDAVQPDVVIHMASHLVPGSSELEYLNERAELGSATVTLANRLAERNILLVFFSSGGAVYGPQPGATLSEHRTCAPISFYGQAKLEVESYIKFAKRSLGLRYLVVRPSNPYGPGQDPRRGQGLISVITDRALRHEPLEVWGDGSVVRDYVHVQDLCTALVHLLNKGVEGQAVNIGSGTGHSLMEVVDIVEQNLGVKISLSFKEARAVDSPRAVLDISRMLEHGVPEPRSLDSGVRSYVEHLRGSK